MLQLVKAGETLERVSSVPDQLRRIALDVEEGRLVGVTSASVIVRYAGAELMVYGIGDGDPITRLHAAYMLLSLACRELERVATETAKI